MKSRTLVLIFILVELIACGCATTPEPPVGEPMIVQRVIEIEGTQDELNRKANEWEDSSWGSGIIFSEGGYNTKGGKLGSQDKEEGVIVAQCFTRHDFGFLAKRRVYYNMTIEVKENKTRIKIEGVCVELTGFDIQTFKPIESYGQTNYNEIKETLNAVIDDFSAYMKQESEE
jgi:hypothetical protein